MLRGRDRLVRVIVCLCCGIFVLFGYRNWKTDGRVKRREIVLFWEDFLRRSGRVEGKRQVG